MRGRFLIFTLALAAWLVAGCDRAPMPTEGLVIVEQRPDVIVYEDEQGDWARVWAAGPVNVACNLRAYSKTHPAGQLGEHVDSGASFLGSFDHTPVPGDTLRGVLLPYAPVVDSVGATVGGFTLICTLPDTLEGLAWALVPSAPFGPDTLKTGMRLVRIH